DGIRDFHVTGVQTCALPISASGVNGRFELDAHRGFVDLDSREIVTLGFPRLFLEDFSFTSLSGRVSWLMSGPITRVYADDIRFRSEERRVGKECERRGEESH